MYRRSIGTSADIHSAFAALQCVAGDSHVAAVHHDDSRIVTHGEAVTADFDIIGRSRVDRRAGIAVKCVIKYMQTPVNACRRLPVLRQIRENIQGGFTPRHPEITAPKDATSHGHIA